MTTSGCHDVCMTTSLSHEESFRRIKEARAQAIEHTKIARRFSAERRELMLALIDGGVSQADIARELGVTRQAVQKMLAC
jgi:DNA invertase Pin-like site-specific DNA recombinase